MTSPKLATTDARGKRFYEWRGDSFWSVTTILSAMPKPALVPWGMKAVATGAVEAVEGGLLVPMVEQDREGAIRYLKGLPYAHRDRAADLGTYLHAAIEAYVLGKPFPKWTPLVTPRMHAFEDFLAKFEPRYEMTEETVFSRSEAYAGTLDAVLVVGRGPHKGRRLLVDSKTGKGVYPETSLQLSAYKAAEFIGLPDGSETPMIEVDGAAVLHLPEAGGFELIDVQADEETFLAFKYVREVFRFQQVLSKSVIRAPLGWEGDVTAVQLVQETLPLVTGDIT